MKSARIRNGILPANGLLMIILAVGVLLTGCDQQTATAPPEDSGTGLTTADTPEKSETGEDPYRIEVSMRGFNGKPRMELLVNEGQDVEITFVHADYSLPDNPHPIAVPGLGISTETLTQENPEETIRIGTPEPGRYRIVCDDPSCVGHGTLINGTLVVGSIRE